MSNNQITNQSTASLFRIIVTHGAPKGSHTSTETYIVAPDEKRVMEWIDEVKNCGAWADEDNQPRLDDDDETEIPFVDWIMKNRGDLDDEEGWDNAHYGVTKWGWAPVEATTEEITVLVKLGIAIIVEAEGGFVSAPHTPGPWSIADTSICANTPTKDICIAVIEDDGGYEAETEERAANARLIAAAPDLLAALELWQHVWEKTECEHDDCVPAFEAARAAIAKAKGDL